MSDPVIGLRRPGDLRPDEPLPEGDPALLARIHAEIDATGPITFARFMTHALYDPDHGYYTAATARPGTAGDFLTAPEGHPIFGWTLARQVEEVWQRLGRPDAFTIREHGAGTGTLALGILDGLRRSGTELADTIRYEISEVADARAATARDRIAEAGFHAAVVGPESRPIVGIILANELADALPVHRVVGGSGGALLEVGVGRGPDGTLIDVEIPPSTPALGERLRSEGIVLAPGQRAEICLELDRWVAAAGSGLRQGLMIVIDYGHRASDLYDARRRPNGTLLAYVRHRVHADLYARVGRQDLTAHVDLTAVERAGVAAGLDLLGTTTQAEFLAGLGVGDLLVDLQAGPEASIAAYLAARSAVARLLDPAATGRFGVILMGRDLEAAPPLRGLAVRLPRRS